MEKQAAFEKIAQVRAKLMLRGAYEAGVRDGMGKEGARGDHILKAFNKLVRAVGEDHGANYAVRSAIDGNKANAASWDTVQRQPHSFIGGLFTPPKPKASLFSFLRDEPKTKISGIRATNMRRDLVKELGRSPGSTVRERVSGLPAAQRAGSSPNRITPDIRGVLSILRDAKGNQNVNAAMRDRGVLARALQSARKAKMGR